MGDVTYARVVILGDEYRIAGEAQGAPVPELAAYVDDKMNEVRRQSPSPDLKRVAVMASLNLADELFRERARHAALTAELQERLTRMAATLTEVLGEETVAAGANADAATDAGGLAAARDRRRGR